ncbi:MAG TPA: metallophosphoesterase family protein [Allosphingosinicella sp.]
MTIFFTSDTHFGDHRTLNIHKRPFRSVAEMDEVMIAAWNDSVGEGDEVWHLGDFARKPADVPALLGRLSGRKHLIRGNNDDPAIAGLPGWASVRDYHEMELEGRRLVLCHYPFRSWNGQHCGALNLHGHSHGKLKPMPRQHDVGVDARGFRPVTLSDLLG